MIEAVNTFLISLAENIINFHVMITLTTTTMIIRKMRKTPHEISSWKRCPIILILILILFLSCFASIFRIIRFILRVLLVLFVLMLILVSLLLISSAMTFLFSICFSRCNHSYFASFMLLF